MTASARNIGPAGRRRRYRTAAVLLVIGAALTVILVGAGVARGYRLAAGVPLTIAALAFFQARAHT